MNFQQKYIKYKQKYNILKNNINNQIAGDLFESLFDKLINYCLLFNKKNDDNYLFGNSKFNRYLHIKGGSSIKYHLKNLNKPEHHNITSDLDIFLVCDTKDYNSDTYSSYLDEFFTGLQILFQDYTLKLETFNNLNIISFNDIIIIDITIFDYNIPYINDDIETSIFYFAIEKMGFDNEKSYFDSLNLLDDIDTDLNLLEKKTFTPLLLEKFACIKGIKLQQYYINLFPTWNFQFNYYKNKIKNIKKHPSRFSKNEINHTHKLFKIYFKQNSYEYKQKIINKFNKYSLKYCILSKLT